MKFRKTALALATGAVAAAMFVPTAAQADPTPVGGSSVCGRGLNELQCVLFEAAHPRIPG